jgi:hypothetical protein
MNQANGNMYPYDLGQELLGSDYPLTYSLVNPAAQP